MCKRWIRLIQGLRIRDRLQKQYAPSLEVAPPEHWLDAEIPAPGGDEVSTISAMKTKSFYHAHSLEAS